LLFTDHILAPGKQYIKTTSRTAISISSQSWRMAVSWLFENFAILHHLLNTQRIT